MFCWLGAVCALILSMVSDSWGATATSSLTINANISSRAQISLDRNVINFVDFTGQSESSVPANENPVTITVKAKTGVNSKVTLTFLATDDLRSGNQTVPISRVTWTATGTGYQNGTMSRAAAQAVGSWTGSGSYAGTLSFFLDVRGQLSTGAYTSQGTFTLTAP